MAYLVATRRARIEARITAKEAALALADAAYQAAMVEVEEYRFDSGEASQRTKNRQLEEFTKAISQLEREIESLYRKLQGFGVVSVNLRRRGSSVIY